MNFFNTESNFLFCFIYLFIIIFFVGGGYFSIN